MVEAHYGASNIGLLIGFSYEHVNTDWMDTHGARIRAVRKKLKLTQEDLAELSKVDQSTLSGIEKHNAMPSGETLIRLCEALNVQAEYVMRGRSATWPFRVEMGRFLALSNEDRAYVEGRLEAAIESRESSPGALSINTVTNQPVTSTTPASATKTSAYVESLKGVKRGAKAGVKSRGASKSRGGRGSKGAA